MQLQTLDLVVFIVTLLGVMAVGFFAGRQEETSEDYFLAGKGIRWFGVAGSIFGSNVSANHMVGMLGVGFSIGFAQSHFELGAIAGLLLMCYGFLPVYRKLNLYTLSEYLERRYGGESRLLYALIMVIIMAFVQMVPGLYIGARTVCVLMGDMAMVTEPGSTDTGAAAVATTQAAVPTVASTAQPQAAQENVRTSYYVAFVIALGVIAASYTIIGGLKAVVYTDVIQSVLILFGGIAVALLTFSELGGWGRMMMLDEAAGANAKLKLYEPMNHPELPWTGVLTGLMFMHCYYWGTNQFIVQRALGARTGGEARLGIIVAGFLKLLIPFFAIGTGVAAFYLFRETPAFQNQKIAPDTVFPVLVTYLISPLGIGFVGLIAAGLIGAILSSIDSMMNSAATIITIDIYRKYFSPDATDREMIRVGRLSIIALMLMAIVMAVFIMDPNSQSNFFLNIANYSNYLTPGVLVAFLMGIFWTRGTRLAAWVTIIAGLILSPAVQIAYDSDMNRTLYDLALEHKQLADVSIRDIPPEFHARSVVDFEQHLENEVLPEISVLHRALGPQLNFFHRVVVVIGLSAVIFVIVSLTQAPDEEKNKNTWSALGGHAPQRLGQLAASAAVSVVVFAVLAAVMVAGSVAPAVAAWLAALWTLATFLREVWRSFAALASRETSFARFAVSDDRSYAGLLAAAAMFMMYYFY